MSTTPALPLFRAAALARGGAAVARVLAGSLLLALSARVQVPLLPSGIPFTLQTPVVLGLAACLGRREAVGAVLTTLAAAAAGAPVLAGVPGAVALVGPRAGFWWGFVVAAAYLGGAGRARRAAPWAVASALLVACGWARLALLLGPRAAWTVGVAPFWVADLAKATATFLLWRAGHRLAGAPSRRG